MAIDESHEMLINRDCKAAITRPSKETINQVALYFLYRSKVLQNLKTQLGSDVANDDKMREMSMHYCKA